MDLRTATTTAARLLADEKDNEALSLIASALSHARKVGDAGAIRALTRLASTVYERRKEYGTAAKVLEEGSGNDPLSLYTLGQLYEGAGQTERALRLYRRALADATASGDQPVIELVNAALHSKLGEGSAGS